ncbi:FAD-binding monooxygenase [Hyphomonas adhaerens MHS-3]|uniref:FAD-binding monooxygenase n=1 Tax=Hyphomonas adhaerens MHS-3 TaxID=1280949 RepID=A0A069E7R9_9PROT|nr:bifunctional 3-(3-hydroxy-phenyl)propionate/3-hydroxycinnamic acid hydroxylase [Hyphomonas adhaerens]KCZ86107.1 FAD-binding monooxygenase [Hyphomonas adhaerens MHS-3]
MSGPDCDVLIVGAGPTGISLALVAAQYGASVIVCEKEADIYPLPRAAHIDHEVMRIFQSVGAADQIAATCRTTSHYDFLTSDGQILLQFEGSDQLGPGGWSGANMIHQPSLERALRDRLPNCNSVELRSLWAFTGYEESGESVSARFEAPDGQRTVTARFLVGADGTRSPVRTAAGIELDDLQFDEPWLVIDMVVQDAERLPKVNLQICDPARPTTCVLMGEGRHRWEFMLLPGETPEQVLDDAFIEGLLKPWNVDGAATLERKAVYRFNARVAKAWKKGRVLLAGDAAHQTPPFAGQGMCAGARDAANLGWKLGMVASGTTNETLLDTYQLERDPHARATIQMAMMMGRTVCITDPAAAAERDRQMLAARAAGQSPDGRTDYPDIGTGLLLDGSAGAGTYFPQFLSADGSSRLDDSLGPGAWLIGDGTFPSVPGLQAVSLNSGKLDRYSNEIRKWLERHNTEAVLVRPDRYVFGTGTSDDLIRAWKDAIA